MLDLIVLHKSNFMPIIYNIIVKNIINVKMTIVFIYEYYREIEENISK